MLTPAHEVGETITTAQGTGVIQSVTITATKVTYVIKATVTTPQTRVIPESAIIVS